MVRKHSIHCQATVLLTVVVDCNDACAKSAVTVPAASDLLIEFDHASVDIFETGVGDYLDVHSAVVKMAAVTRIVRLGAYMINNAAVLTQSASQVVA